MTSKLYVMEPITITTIASSTMSESYPYSAYNAGTAYVLGDRVSHSGSRSFYEATTSVTGVDPSTDLTGKWVRMGANNTWRAFDQRITEPVIQITGDIIYEIDPMLAPADCVAVFGVQADYVNVIVSDPTEGVIYDETVSCADNRNVIDAYSYFFSPVIFRSEAVFSDIPIFTGYAVSVAAGNPTVGATAMIGEIAIGKNFLIGNLLAGGTAGIDDFSAKERDVFGNFEIIERTYSDSAEYHVQIDSARTNIIKRALARLRATPAVYHAGQDYVDFGQTIYGFYQQLSVEISTNASSTVTLQIEGLS